MHLTTSGLLLYSSTALAAISLRATTFERLAGLQKRQIPTCVGFAPEGVPNPCEYICGEGSRTCVYDDQCFNPTLGETCCSDGTYCPSGYYCSDGGCCPDGMSLEECGATTRLATLPGGGAPTVPASSSSATATAETTTTAAAISYSDTTSSSSTLVSPTEYLSSTSSSSSMTSSSAVASIYPTLPSNGTNGTVPSYTPTSSFIPAQQATNAAYRCDITGWTFGGLTLFGLGFFL